MQHYFSLPEKYVLSNRHSTEREVNNVQVRQCTCTMPRQTSQSLLSELP